MADINGTGAGETLTGTEGSDTINGFDGDDTLFGLGGNDSLNGGGGRDTVDGGAGDDTIIDTFGTDTLIGGDGNDTIRVTFGSGAGQVGSIRAGEGNDIVELQGLLALSSGYPGTSQFYSVDLGAGDDTLRLDGPNASVTLGAGRDRIIYASQGAILSNGSLTINDFAAGDAGDIFDLAAFLQSPLSFGSNGLTLIERGHNPFALGYAQLRQVGNNVELWVHPNGLVEDGYVQTPVRFLNTSVGQLTAANFGGFDPQVRPNLATVVNASVTIAAGEVREALNMTPVSNLSAQFVYHNLTGARPDFVNHGTLSARQTDPAFGYLTGIYVAPGWTPGGSFVNASNGRMVVRSDVELANGATFRPTYGFHAPSQSVLFRNDGHFEVSAASGRVVGVLAGFDVFNFYSVVNNGNFLAYGTGEVVGFQLGQTSPFSNTGTITVSSSSIAVGLLFEGYRSGQFSNGGTITVTTAQKSPYDSVGVYVFHGRDSVFLFSNAGTITADIAFFSDDGADSSVHFIDRLENSGTINGDVLLGRGADTLLNSGSVTGIVFLGAGNDLYDGRAGTITGLVSGDDGDDTFFGGSGDDAFRGGAGNDRMDGGLGIDTAVFAGTRANYTLVNLGGGLVRVTAADGVDTISAIERLQFDDMRLTVPVAIFHPDSAQASAEFGAAPWAGGWTSQDDFPRVVADINGDGRADIVGFGNAGTFVALGQANGTFGAMTQVSFDFGQAGFAGGWASGDRNPRQLADVNGDGRADIVGFGEAGVYVALADGSGRFGAMMPAVAAFGAAPAAGGWESQNLFGRTLADVNGDGRADIVGFGNAGTYVALGQADGSFSGIALATSQFGRSADVGGWASQDEYPRMLADVNGDGRADIVGFGEAATYAALGQADGTFAAMTLVSANFGRSASAGGWASQNLHARHAVDVNGDGLADLLGFGDAGVYYALNDGSGGFGALTFALGAYGAGAGGWSSGNLYPRTFADVNGDGLADVIGFGEAGVFVTLADGFDPLVAQEPAAAEASEFGPVELQAGFGPMGAFVRVDGAEAGLVPLPLGLALFVGPGIEELGSPIAV